MNFKYRHSEPFDKLRALLDGSRARRRAKSSCTKVSTGYRVKPGMTYALTAIVISEDCTITHKFW
jgi:hypothetical protein